MGIPRLLQDLLPYAETATIGQCTPCLEHDDDKHIEKIIIDGPALVYFIYNKILTLAATQRNVGIIPSVSYRLINDTTEHFLDTLVQHRVEIDRIYFDGGLPLDKHEIRLERLEKTRQQLVHMRKVDGESIAYPAPTDAGSNIEDVSGLDRILWNEHGLSVNRQLPPPPPLMVASVIESLLHHSTDKWRMKVEVVAGEADQFCASRAKETGAAILTNDSDLTLYDTSESSWILLLNSLEQSEVFKQSQRYTLIRAQAIKPNVVAKRMQLSSLLVYGFYRSRDSSAGSGAVLQKARTHTQMLDGSEEAQVEFTEFSKQYLSIPVRDNIKLPRLTGLDPRVSEFVLQFWDCSRKQPPVVNIYHPIILEDPSRDAAWSYGAHIRQLAYSCASLLTNPGTTDKGIDLVVEYFRKGQRIAPTTVKLLRLHETTEKLRQSEQKFEEIRNVVKRDIFTNASELTTTSNAEHANKMVFFWHLFALTQVISQIQQASTQGLERRLLIEYLCLEPRQTTIPADTPSAKSTSTKTKRKRLKTPSRPFNDSKDIDNDSEKISWSVQHLHAKVQAVLYSWRILIQILAHYKNNQMGQSSEMMVSVLESIQTSSLLTLSIQLNAFDTTDQVQGLRLRTEDHFLDIPNLRALMNRIPLNERTVALSCLEGLN